MYHHDQREAYVLIKEFSWGGGGGGGGAIHYASYIPSHIYASWLLVLILPLFGH